MWGKRGGDRGSPSTTGPIREPFHEFGITTDKMTLHVSCDSGLNSKNWHLSLSMRPLQIEKGRPTREGDSVSDPQTRFENP